MRFAFGGRMRLSTLAPFICTLAIGCGSSTSHVDGNGGSDDMAHAIAASPDLAPGIVTVDIGDGVSVRGSFAGDQFTLLTPPTSFEAPLIVTLVSRLGYTIHDAADLSSACAVALGPTESLPTFSGTMLFDPLSQSWLGATILHSPAGQRAGVTDVYVTNPPIITSAQSSEPSLAASVQAALTATPRDAAFTSNNWSLLCAAAKSTAPSTLATLSLAGTFNGASYDATIALDTLVLQLN